ncbi:hypothetical protein BDV32DRAFT_133839 [Aspergillus pseudonomiae]|uniref:Uncharacterized protein n=1 Tax=Aspergillus pseudonomiae TaxID=1506151 RepID=A0A5N6HIT6_9EURO|nr:uncharacterized protein BDV37DRAFT_258678 [Aspergillus pseudonomiae]KAB8253619.1 hypothetical protein BDV32DRAFT_133839 [Aspergillus pseudonomiae]KAE8400012.1 hypothetical protein BDV37DRAFT_258678 [Aspergillus pseudonomiae]
MCHVWKEWKVRQHVVWHNDRQTSHPETRLRNRRQTPLGIDNDFLYSLLFFIIFIFIFFIFSLFNVPYTITITTT